MICKPIALTVYRGRDNVAPIGLVDGEGAILDVSTATRVVLEVGGVTFDSADLGSSIIWFDGTVDHHGEQVPAVQMRIGLAGPLSGLADGVYVGGSLRIYDAENPQGYRAETPVKVEVIS